MTTKFIHIRARRANGSVLEKGGTTVAYDFNPETRIAHFAVAYCSKRDNYCKRIGRDVASGRLKWPPADKVHIPEGQSVASTIVEAL